MSQNTILVLAGLIGQAIPLALIAYSLIKLVVNSLSK